MIHGTRAPGSEQKPYSTDSPSSKLLDADFRDRGQGLCGE